MRFIAFATLAAAASAFALTAAAADQGQQKSTAKPDDGSKIICKGGASGDETGTRLPPKKICHTKREWDEMAAQERQALDANMSHQQGTTAH